MSYIKYILIGENMSFMRWKLKKIYNKIPIKSIVLILVVITLFLMVWWKYSSDILLWMPTLAVFIILILGASVICQMIVGDW